MARGWRDYHERRINPNQLTKKQYRDALQYFKFKCAYCGAKMEDCKITKDHVQAISKGGLNIKHNVIPACLSCNQSKGAKEMYAWYKGQQFFDRKKLAKIDVWFLLNKKA